VHTEPEPQELDVEPDRPGERTLELPAAEDPPDRDAAESGPPLRLGPIRQALEGSAEFTEAAATIALGFIQSIIP